MTTRDLSELLDGLPATTPALVAAARAYDAAGDHRNAEAILRAALARQSTPRLRLASAEHLLTRSRWAAAYQQARHAMADPALWEAAVAAARASHKLGEHGRAQTHLDDALDRGADLNLISAWRDHFSGLAAPPSASMRGDDANAPALEVPDFTEEPTELVEELAPHESTHLVNIPSSVLEAPRAVPPSFERDETTQRRRRPRELRPGASQELGDAVTNDLGASPSEPTGVYLPDPTLPPGADLAQELPKHDSGRRVAPGLSVGAPAVAPRSERRVREKAAAKRRRSAEPLELDLEALEKTRKPSSGRTSSIRRLTHLVQTRLPEPLQSPARALATTLISALVVLLFFSTLAYTWQVHRAISGALAQVEADLHQDTYASHARALQRAEKAQGYELLPSAADTLVRRATDALPLVSTRAPRERAADLEVLVRARSAFRFEHPGHISPPEAEPAKRPELLAAQIYANAAWLPARDLVEAVDALVARAPFSPWVRLAHAEVLAEHADTELATKFVEALPEDTNARSFARAQHLLKIDEKAATTALRAIFDATPDHHSSRLTLAAHLARSESDADDVEALLASADSASARDIGPADRAAMHLVRAEAADKPRDRMEALRLAAEAAPLRPDRVRPLIDALLVEGQLLGAREQLVRTPEHERRHPYFDLALASTHLQIGDTARAIALLNAASEDPRERLLLALAMAAEGNHDIALSELRDAPLDLAAANLLDTLRGTSSKPPEDFDPEAPFAAERALLESAALATLANRADTWEVQESLRRQAQKRLEHGDDSPARRLLSCRLALDARDAERAKNHCTRHEELDSASRWAVDTLARWHRLGDRHGAALRLLDRHEDLSGAHPQLALLRAELELARGDQDAAAARLEPALGTPTSRSPRWATFEGDLSRVSGDHEQALAYYDAALERSPSNPAATLGRILTLLYDEPLESDDEQALRALLRHGEVGPMAWIAFARQRRLQERHADASENLEFAKRAASTLASGAFHHTLHTEDAYARAARSSRAFDDPAVARALDDAEAHAPLSADYHVARARQALASRRPDRALAAQHLEDALDIAPLRCELWPEVISLRERLRHPVAVRRLKQNRPERCD